MFKSVSFIVFLGSVVGLSRPAIALADSGGSELASVEDLSFQPDVFLVSIQHKKDCARVGAVCLFANGGGTIAGVDVNPTVGIVTTLARGTQVATLTKTDKVPEADAWHVEMIARFRTRTSDDPITVAFMDYTDPDGMARKEATAVWRIEGSLTKDLGMRLVFTAEDGFQARHTYLVRMVQGDGANEKILAEGNFLLE
jgi:hypothetical protein